MTISVLIAVMRPGAALSDALSGVAGQTHPDWDVVVVESGGNREAEPVVRAFAGAHGSIHYESLDENTGLVAARNRLLELAAGDAIAFLEPDDVWLPRHLATAMTPMDAGADIVVANARLHDPKTDRVVTDMAVPPALAARPVRTLFARDLIPSVSCVVMRRTTALATGRFDSRFRSGEARDYWLRCALNGARFAVTERTSCRCGRVQLTTGERALQHAEQTVQFYEKHRDLSAVPAALRRRLLAGSLVAQGRLLRTIDPSRAARCFWRAWSLQPVYVQTLGQFALTEWRFAAPSEPHDVA